MSERMDYWPEKGLRTEVMQPDGRWLDLVVTGADGNIRAFLLPEWLIERIIAGHDAEAQLAAQAGRIEQLEAFPFTLKYTNDLVSLCWKGDYDAVYDETLRAEVIKWLAALAPAPEERA